jgi:hypothetical protein
VGVWGFLAATTTTITSPTSVTTIAQGLGSQGDSGGGGIWVTLVAALLGAVAGSAATLVGSVLVNRWELRRTARFRMYQELVPRVKETWPRVSWRGEGRDEFEKSLHALERAGAVAGPLEWRCAVMVRINGEGYANIFEREPDSYELQELDQKLQDELRNLNDSISRLDKILQEHVRRLWPARRLRLRDRLRKLLRRGGSSHSKADLKAKRIEPPRPQGETSD